MNVEELIIYLNGIRNKNIPVLLSKDSEGNSFSKLSDTTLTFGVENSPYYDLVDDIDEEEDREEVLVLWPEV
jgi:hypothetical protein